MVTGGATWLTNLQVQSLGSNKYKIAGDFAGTSAAVSTILTLTCDNLSQFVDVSWNPEISTLKDRDSYVLDLLNTTNHNWTIQIMNPSSTTWLALHPTASLPAAFPGVDGFYRNLIVIIILMLICISVSEATEAGRVQMSSVVGGKTKACKIIIVQ